MTDVGVRLAVIVVILLAVAVAAAFTRRTRWARPVRTTRDDLPPGVHLFTSTTCATCDDARKVIVSVYVDGFTEIRHEDDPQSFAHHGIARVPTVIVVGQDRMAMVFEGVPRRRHLPPVPARPIANG